MPSSGVNHTLLSGIGPNQDPAGAIVVQDAGRGGLAAAVGDNGRLAGRVDLGNL